jgi:hypothetical protein
LNVFSEKAQAELANLVNLYRRTPTDRPLNSRISRSTSYFLTPGT